MKTKIMLQSGNLFDLLNPYESDFTIEDIAHGLSNVCRFSGQVMNFYSVAEHCANVSFCVPDEYKFAALLHDASEAFIGDIASPLKALLPDYLIIEKKVEDAISKRFLSKSQLYLGGFDAPIIKQADRAMCRFEADNLMPSYSAYWDQIKVEPQMELIARKMPILCVNPYAAYLNFLTYFNEYGSL